LRVKVARANHYSYPDVVVVCGQAEFEDRSEDTLLNPTVLIEVLSPSTEAYDRGAKFGFFRLLESLADDVLVSQERPLIEIFTRQPDTRWLLSTHEGLDAVATIPSIACTLPLTDVYDKVTWPVEELRPQSIRVVKEPGESYTTP
jgi:Uma2 family endonuclease